MEARNFYLNFLTAFALSLPHVRIAVAAAAVLCHWKDGKLYCKTKERKIHKMSLENIKLFLPSDGCF